jgi:folate-binding protein YgfZ
MAQNALLHRLRTQDARLGSYSGTETILSFTDPESEFRALSSGAGLFDLGWRAKIMVTGRDRIRWLNGMITNNVKDLPLNRGAYSFVLNHQGRILGDLYVYNRGEYLLLDTDRSQVENLIKTLGRFIIMDKVELNDPGETLSAIGVCGPQSESVLSSAGFDVAGLEPLEVRDIVVDGASVTMVRGPQEKPGWYEVWAGGAGTPPRHANIGRVGDPGESLWDKLAKAGAQPVGTEALERWRIVQGIPKYGQDIRERDLPQETEQNQALNFSKGCYIGQEIVERIRSRGQVHRAFTGFEFEDALPQPGKFEENGRVTTEITSIAEVDGRKIGLGYVRRETGPPGSTVDLQGIKAKVTNLPFRTERN